MNLLFKKIKNLHLSMSQVDFYSTESYLENGFIIIKDIINQEEIVYLRKSLYSYFIANPKKSHVNIGYILDNKIASLFFKKQLVKKLKLIFGEELFFMNDFQLQFNSFASIYGKAKGLHTDCRSEFSPKNKYLFQSKYKFAKVGLYLQDNTEEYGGGIDVVIGSHKVWKRFPISIINYLATRLYLRLYRIYNKKRIRVPIKSGSAVVFDSRLSHASSRPQSKEKNILIAEKGRSQMPFENCKYAIYMDVCSPGYEKTFIDNSYKRAFSDENTLPSHKLYFTNHLSYDFPNDFPGYYKSLVEENKIQMPSLDKKRLEKIRELKEIKDNMNSKEKN